jgi:hypothetical protein
MYIPIHTRKENVRRSIEYLSNNHFVITIYGRTPRKQASGLRTTRKTARPLGSVHQDYVG